MFVKVNLGGGLTSTFFYFERGNSDVASAAAAYFILVENRHWQVLEFDARFFQRLTHYLHLAIHRMNVIQKLLDGTRHGIGQVLGRAIGVEADLLCIRAATILGGIGRDVVAPDYPSRHPDHGGAGRHVLHHGVGADAHAFAEHDWGEHLGARAHHHIAAEGGMALAFLPTGAAQCDAW